MTDQNKSSPEPILPRMSEVGEQKPLKTSGFGTASFILGIIAMYTCGSVSIPGLIFGIISIKQAKAKKVSSANHWFTIAGIVFNAVAILILIGVIVSLQMSKMTTANNDRRQCARNLKQLGTAMLMYMNENDMTLPPSDKWVNLLSPYTRFEFIYECPSESKAKIGYAMNNGASGITEDQMKDSSFVVVLFDSIQKDNPHGGTELLPSPERHILYQEDASTNTDKPQRSNKSERYLKVNNLCFADGHAKSMTANQVHSVIWNPIKK